MRISLMTLLTATILLPPILVAISRLGESANPASTLIGYVVLFAFLFPLMLWAICDVTTSSILASRRRRQLPAEVNAPRTIRVTSAKDLVLARDVGERPV